MRDTISKDIRSHMKRYEIPYQKIRDRTRDPTLKALSERTVLVVLNLFFTAKKTGNLIEIIVYLFLYFTTVGSSSGIVLRHFWEPY